jgi:hypothetical protein
MTTQEMPNVEQMYVTNPPEGITAELLVQLPEMLSYLDDLRESGVTNMFGAAPYVESEFGIGRRDAQKVLAYWMKTFSIRHPQS